MEVNQYSTLLLPTGSLIWLVNFDKESGWPKVSCSRNVGVECLTAGSRRVFIIVTFTCIATVQTWCQEDEFAIACRQCNTALLCAANLRYCLHRPDKSWASWPSSTRSSTVIELDLERTVLHHSNDRGSLKGMKGNERTWKGLKGNETPDSFFAQQKHPPPSVTRCFILWFKGFTTYTNIFIGARVEHSYIFICMTLSQSMTYYSVLWHNPWHDLIKFTVISVNTNGDITRRQQYHRRSPFDDH